MPLPFILAGLGALWSGATAAAATAAGAAATAGAAAAGAAGAVGAAATGAASAAGAAAAGAAGAAGTAAAGAASAVGTAAAGAASAVGAAATGAGSVVGAATSSAVGAVSSAASSLAAGEFAAAAGQLGSLATAPASSALSAAKGSIAKAIIAPSVSSVAEAVGSAAAATSIARHTPVGSLAESLIDNVFRDTVAPVEGSIVHCSLFGVEHSGVYVGDGEIIHLLGTGSVVRTDADVFVDSTNAITIYVACIGDTPIGSKEVAKRAKWNSPDARNYNVLFDNCHQFTAGCITGNFENGTNFFWLLESLIAEKLAEGNSITWRAWERSAM